MGTYNDISNKYLQTIAIYCKVLQYRASIALHRTSEYRRAHILQDSPTTRPLSPTVST